MRIVVEWGRVMKIIMLMRRRRRRKTDASQEGCPWSTLKLTLCIALWPQPSHESTSFIRSFLDGLARNQSIQTLDVKNLGDYGSTAILRALSNFTQLDELVYGCNNPGLNGCSTIGALLESGACKLKKLWLGHNNIGDDGVAALASGLRSIGPSLTYLGLS
eukprot:scaffold15567_cov74-Skeletonema_dohrnii-CCMP3373.AAC.5